jgi:GTPase SAR1 family protein
VLSGSLGTTRRKMEELKVTIVGDGTVGKVSALSLTDDDE